MTLICVRMHELGLFPLPLVLLPDEQVPLHIFEPRYRELIGECLEHDRPFGLVLAEPSSLAEIGTTAAVTEVLRRYEDDKLDIVVQGRERFRILGLSEGRSFLTAETDPVEDIDDPPDRDAVARCLERFHELAELASPQPPPPLELSGETRSVAYAIASRIELDLETKQALLEQRSERLRLEQLEPVLGQLVDQLRQVRMIRERAAGNGHIGELGG